MPPRKRLDLDLTGPQARYVLNSLLADRRITERDVRNHLNNLHSEIASLESRLELLRDTSVHTGKARRSAGRSNGIPAPTGAPKRRRVNLSPERRAALKKQGLYLALMRQIPKTKRAAFKAMFRKSGMDPTLAAMQKVVAG
jgi:hypothetical protein